MFKFQVRRTELNLQDLAINLDEVTLLQNSQVFTLKNVGTDPFEADESLVAMISIHGYDNLQVIERSNYTVLDLLGDIGGL